MTVKIEIVGDDVEHAQERMLALIEGSRIYKRSIDDAFAEGGAAERWKGEEAKWQIQEIEDVADFVQRLARLISGGAAKEFFPEWSRDFARCEKLSGVLDLLIAIKKKPA